MAAPRRRAVTATTLMKICNRRKLSVSVAPMNGPTWRAVSQVAIAETTSVVVAASRWPNRSAAQIEKGKTAKASGEWIVPVANQPPNTI